MLRLVGKSQMLRRAFVRRRALVLVGVVMLQTMRGVADAGQVMVTPEQAAYLRSQAKVVRRNVTQLKKTLSKWDRDPGVTIGSWGEPEPEGTLGSGIEKAIRAATSACNHFVAISTSEQQKAAAKIFFGDILSRYSQLMEQARIAPTCHSTCYPEVRDKAIQAMELNASVYDGVADGGLAAPSGTRK